MLFVESLRRAQRAARGETVERVGVALVARVAGFQGNEYTQETTFADYKDFGGIKKATKVESKRDGQKYLEMEVGDFQVLEKVEPGTFDEPN